MQIVDLFASPLHIHKLGLDIKSLIEFCREMRKQNQGVEISNIGGWQSRDIKNESHSEFAKLKLEIQKATYAYQKALQFKESAKQELDNIWVNINGVGHSNELHVHTQSVLSGVFYLTDSKYPITFQHPFEDINNYFWKSEVIGNCNTINSCFWSIPPKRNLLIIFPSWLKHKVELNKDETERVSISFNTQVANEQGKPKSLTQKQFNNAMDEVMKEVNKK